MQHPEYLYWLALAVFGVPAIVLARAVVPAMAILIVSVNVIVWHFWPNSALEGLLLLVLYTTAFFTSLAWKMSGAETFAAAMWWPMALAAFWQWWGGDAAETYKAIYVLAITQIVAFIFIMRWPATLVRRLTSRSRARNGGYRACPA